MLDVLGEGEVVGEGDGDMPQVGVLDWVSRYRRPEIEYCLTVEEHDMGISWFQDTG